MRVLVDTSVFISSLLKAHPDSFLTVLLASVLAGEITMLYADAQLEELEVTVRRKPHLLKIIGDKELTRVMVLLKKMGVRIPVIMQSIPPITRDPKDDYLVAYAVVGKADYLISLDKDLLVLGQIQGVKMVHTGEFRAILRELD